ncbi:MAG: energy-coupling factor transporter transmembrane protein EcfT [Clostridiales bacterium]|nr:energy-coupling factor transporter transmembrane protein EcfT [Clostridiales bacterium]
MLNNITLGQFFPGESFIHRLDPRTKILLTIAFLVCVFISRGFLGFGLIVAFIYMCAKVARIQLKFIFRGLKPIAVIVIITFLLNLFMSAGKDVLWKWGILSISVQGIKNAVFMALRLILLVTGTQLLTLTTSPIRLTDGLESLFLPFSKIGFPAHELAMMMSIALRFIPTLIEETQKITRAQKARGADFESGSLIKRAKALLPLLVPLFVSAFRRADELAMAMEARCYRGGKGRTKMRPLRYGRKDLYALCCVILLAGLILVTNASGIGVI